MTYFYLIPQKESKHAINEQGNKGRKNRFGLNQQGGSCIAYIVKS